MENKILTAEEILIKEEILLKTIEEGGNFPLNLTRDTHIGTAKNIKKAMIEFAKLHVQAQREAIKKKATIKKRYDGNIAKEYWEDIVDEQSIDNAYDLNNIK